MVVGRDRRKSFFESGRGRRPVSGVDRAQDGPTCLGGLTPQDLETRAFRVPFTF